MLMLRPARFLGCIGCPVYPIDFGLAVAGGDTFACETNEIIVSALCKDGGTPVLQGGDVSCKGATGIVGLCLRR